MTISTITVTYPHVDGSPVKGTVEITPRGATEDGAYRLLPATLSVPIVNGTATFALDDRWLGLQVTVEEKIKGGGGSTYNKLLPATHGTYNLTALAGDTGDAPIDADLYLPVAARGAYGGVAALDETGAVLDGDGVPIGGGGSEVTAADIDDLSGVTNPSGARTNLGLGTAAVKNVPASGDASSTQVVMGNDTRLSNARTPSAHASSHAAAGSDPLTLSQSQITNLTADLAAKLSAASNLSDVGSASTARTNLGLGTAAVKNAPVSGDASSVQVVMGDDTRLTDTRTPTDNSVTSAKIADGAIVNADINASAAIDPTKINGTALVASTVDAKGDLYVGSADNTVIRKAVGTDGQVLTADAASTGGVKWATPSAGGGSGGSDFLTTQVFL